MNKDGKWDLSSLYGGIGDEAYEADIAKAEGVMTEMEKMLKNKDDSDTTGFIRALIARQEEVSELFGRFGLYGELLLAANANDKPALSQQDRMMKLMMRAQQIASGIVAYIGSAGGLSAVVEGDEYLKEHAFVIREAQEKFSHLMDPALEGTVLRMSMSGAQSWAKLRDQLDAGHMVEVEMDGKRQKMPLSAARGLAYNGDARVRKAAFEAEIASYPKMEVAMAACLNGIKGESIVKAELKKYESPLDAALANARMDRATLEALLAAMQESLPEFRRYFRLKAKALGHEGGLPFYDLFAPLGGTDARTYDAKEAQELLEDVLGGFSAKMGGFVSDMFNENHIDMYPREGKTGGAFCAGCHALKTSFVLTNFDGSLASVGTLAHELGHGYHNLCMKDLPGLCAEYPMPLAETASIFNETLFSDVLKKRCSEGEKLAMIDQELTDAAQVIVDILSRFLFEKEVFARRADHSMSAEELCQIMTDAQKATYGDGLDENCMHPYMWACKSHYYSAGLDFYNFPYAFGLLFGKGVFALYQKMGEDFLPLYDALLARTGCGNVREVAASVGIDVTDVGFWRSSVQVVLEGVSEMAALLGE